MALMKLREAARKFGISRHRLYRARREGEIECVVLGPRIFLVTDEQMEAFLKASTKKEQPDDQKNRVQE